MANRDLSGELSKEGQSVKEALLAAAMMSAFDSMMVSKAESGYPILFVNPAFTELTGYSAEDVIGKTPSILQGPKTDKAVLERLEKDLANGNSFQGKTLNYRKDGSEFMMEWRITPIRNEHDKITHYFAVQHESEAA